MHRTRLLPVALAAALGLALSACGSSAASVDDVASLGTDAPSADSASADDSTDAADDGGDAPDTTLDPQDAALEFARCMREHGVDMPDPEFAEGAGGQGGGVMIQIDGEFDQEEMQEAQEACEPIMEAAVGEFEEPDPEELERMREEMLAFAECMRGKGIDFPDPTFDESGRMTVGIGGPSEDGGPPPSMDIDKMEDAQEACREELGMEGEFGIAVRAEP